MAAMVDCRRKKCGTHRPHRFECLAASLRDVLACVTDIQFKGQVKDKVRWKVKDSRNDVVGGSRGFLTSRRLLSLRHSPLHQAVSTGLSDSM
jgi:hypothetical protein